MINKMKIRKHAAPVRTVRQPYMPAEWQESPQLSGFKNKPSGKAEPKPSHDTGSGSARQRTEFVKQEAI